MKNEPMYQNNNQMTHSLKHFYKLKWWLKSTNHIYLTQHRLSNQWNLLIEIFYIFHKTSKSELTLHFLNLCISLFLQIFNVERSKILNSSEIRQKKIDKKDGFHIKYGLFRLNWKICFKFFYFF